MSHFLSIAFPLVFLSISCIGAGFLISKSLPLKIKDSALSELTLAFLLGQGLLGSLLLIPALMGIFSIPSLLTITIPFLCLGLWAIYATGTALPTALREFYLTFRNTTLTSQILALAVAFIFIGASASMAGIVNGDARAFYLALPKVVAASHRLVPLPAYESFTTVGLLAEMQLAALFLLGMPGASPRLFCWLTGLAGAVILLTISRSAGLGKRGQLISLAIMGTSSAVALLWGQGKTELFAASYGLAAILYALKSWDPASRRSSIILTGLFTGFALVAKLSYLIPFLPSICMLIFWKHFPNLWVALRNREQFLAILKRYFVEGLIFGAALLPAFLPHFAKNLILIGTLVDTYGTHQYFSPDTTAHIVLTYPLMLIFGNYWAQYGNMSPLILAFLPLVLFFSLPKRPWNGPVAALLVSALTGLIAWVALFPAVPMPRYFLANLLILAVPAAWAAERYSRLSKISSHAVMLATLITVLIFYKSWRYEIFPIQAAFRYMFTEQTEKVLNVDEVLSYNVYESINKIAKPGSRVFLFSYFRFWLRPDLIQCSSGARDEIPWDGKDFEKYWLEGSGKFWSKLYENGFTYLFIDNSLLSTMVFKAKPDWVTIEEVYPQSEHGGAYHLVYRNAPGEVRLTTHEVSQGAWDVIPVAQVPMAR